MGSTVKQKTKTEEDGTKEKKGLLSFLANNIIIINDNPEKGEKLRTANVSFVRSPQASFFNLIRLSDFNSAKNLQFCEWGCQ